MREAVAPKKVEDVVTTMGKIYSRATQVLIYLGAHDKGHGEPSRGLIAEVSALVR